MNNRSESCLSFRPAYDERWCPTACHWLGLVNEHYTLWHWFHSISTEKCFEERYYEHKNVEWKTGRQSVPLRERWADSRQPGNLLVSIGVYAGRQATDRQRMQSRRRQVGRRKKDLIVEGTLRVNYQYRRQDDVARLSTAATLDYECINLHSFTTNFDFWF